jgi:hypothetical protein
LLLAVLAVELVVLDVIQLVVAVVVLEVCLQEVLLLLIKEPPILLLLEVAGLEQLLLELLVAKETIP